MVMKKKSILFLVAFTALCTACGGGDDPTSSVNPTLTLDVLNAVVAGVKEKANSIGSGTIDLERKGLGYDAPVNAQLMYEFDATGANMHYTNSTSTSGDVFDVWVLTDESGNIVPIQESYDGGYEKPYIEFSEVNFPYSSILGYQYDTVFGIENLVAKLAESAASNVNKDLEYSLNDGAYTFSFGYWTAGELTSEPEEYYDVSVSFSVAAAGHMDHAKVNVKTYYSTSFLIDSELNVVTLLDDAVAYNDVTYDVNQVAEARDYVCDIQLSMFYATSFDLTYDGEAVTADTLIKVNKGDSAELSLSNILPETTSFDFDEVNVEVVEGDKDGVSGSASYWGNEFNVYGEKVGDYTVKLYTKNVSKNFKMKVTEVAPESVNVSYSTAKPGNGYDAKPLEGSVANGYVGVEYIIQASVAPYNAEQGVVASCTSDNASKCSIVVKNFAISSWGSPQDWNCFTATEPGDYVIRVASEKDASVYTEFTFRMAAAPTFAEVLANDYAYCNYSGVNYKFDFTPISADATEGSLVIEDYGNGKSETVSYKVVADGANYVFELTHVSGDELNVDLRASASKALYMFKKDIFSDGGSYEPLVVFSPKLNLIGSWIGSSDDQSISCDLSFQANGNASLNVYTADDYSYVVFAIGSYDLVASDDGYTGTLTATSYYSSSKLVSDTATFTVNSDFSQLTITMQVDDTTYSFVLVLAQYE